MIPSPYIFTLSPFSNTSSEINFPFLLKTLLSPFLNSLMALCLTFIIRNSYSSLFLKDLLIPMHWLSPAMVLPLLLLQENESIVFVIVPLKLSMTVPVTVTFPSLIVTSDGIHPVPVCKEGHRMNVHHQLCWI